jgi:regulator of sigma E protease
MSWLLAFLGFAALIILHEFGHFLAAKATGMRVERFFLFFPPKLVSFKRGETEYGIGAIPLGGFVKITGMNPDEVRDPERARDSERHEDHRDEDEEEQEEGGGNPAQALMDRIEGPSEPLTPEVLERAYYNQPVWKRIVVIAAGPVMNLLIAFFLLFGLAFGLQEPQGSGLEVAEVVNDSPADGRLEQGDRIVAVDGVRAADLELSDRARRLRKEIDSHSCPGQPTDGCRAATPARIVVKRDGEQRTLLIRPEYSESEKRNLIGFGFGPANLQDVDPSPAEAAGIAVDRMWFVTSKTVEVFVQLFDPEKRKEVSGVVGSYEVTRQAFEFDTRTALTLLAVISLSLAVINLFPFLPLDGGHIFWSLVEKVRRRPVSYATMERAGAVGFVLILFLFFIGLSNDIGRLSGEGFDVR